MTTHPRLLKDLLFYVVTPTGARFIKVELTPSIARMSTFGIGSSPRGPCSNFLFVDDPALQGTAAMVDYATDGSSFRLKGSGRVVPAPVRRRTPGELCVGDNFYVGGNLITFLAAVKGEATLPVYREAVIFEMVHAPAPPGVRGSPWRRDFILGPDDSVAIGSKLQPGRPSIVIEDPAARVRHATVAIDSDGRLVVIALGCEVRIPGLGAVEKAPLSLGTCFIVGDTEVRVVSRRAVLRSPAAAQEPEPSPEPSPVTTPQPETPLPTVAETLQLAFRQLVGRAVRWARDVERETR